PQILAKKALQGTKIVLLIWRNFTMWSKQLDSFHEKLKEEINNTSNVLIEREAAFKNIKIEFSVSKISHSHHQKMVITDDVLYIGGLDLAQGRSDPDLWHDCHARVTGPVVADAIKLICARWQTIDEDDKKTTKLAFTGKREGLKI